VRRFEDTVTSELTWLLRAGVPARAVRITVRDLLVARIERGPLGAREVSDAVEATVRAACRLALETKASSEMVEMVCRAALEGVRGHGGESARWLSDATRAGHAVLDELARQRAEDPTFPWIAQRLDRW